ncbi:MAG: methyl-accepting chemotaxis protein, partial [Thiobacillus sp.]
SQEQSSGIEQVNQAIAQMDEVTQQNAALVEEAAAAAESLQDQAGMLSQAVSVFKMEGGNYSQRPAISSHTSSASAAPRAKPKSAPQKAIPNKNKLAVAGGGSEEWEEF